MAAIGSKLITKEMEWNANMTELNHLGKALLLQPAKFSGKMDKLFSAENYYSDNPMLSQLMGNAKTEMTIDGLEWEWDLRGANTKPLVILENVLPGAVTQPGRNKTTFQIKLDENWYLPGDNICPSSADKRYTVRIVQDAQRSGDGWVYTVRLMNDDDSFFLPLQYLTPGTQWSKLFSNYEEAAEQGGSTSFSLPISLANRLAKYRKQYKITDYASTAVLAVSIPDSTGKMHQSWIRYAEVEFWQQWYRELERAVWYSRSTNTVMGANGRPVRTGPGIQEQLEDSHRYRYNVLTAKLIEEYLQDIFYSRKKPGQGRKVRGYTGEYGMIQFHRAMTDWMQKTGLVKVVGTSGGDFARSKPSDYHANGLSVGYQVVEYQMANGATLELVHNPLYDDREINSELDHITGMPMESQRITFLDFADGADSNVKLVKKKDGEAFTYINGMYGPYGPSKPSDSPAHSGDYYEMHVEKHVGVHINDVTRCGELILSRN